MQKLQMKVEGSLVQRVLTSPLAGPALVIVGFLLLLEKSIAGLTNMDTYFHLRVGSEMLTGNWAPNAMGHFNGADSEAWVSTQWASQLGLAFIYENLGGYAALVVAMAVGYMLFAGAIYALLKKYTTGLIAGALTLSFIWAHGSWISLRPQMISFFLIMLTAHLWLQASRTGRVPWLVIPLMALWPNLHGIWIAGLANIFVFTVAYSLDRGWRGKQWLVLTGSVLATLCTPTGWRLWEGVISVTTKSSALIDEWGAPDYTGLDSGLAFLLLGLMVVLLAKYKPTSWTLASMAFMALGWALWSSRSMAFSTLLVALVIAALLSAPIESPRQAWKWEWPTIAGGALAALALLAAFFPTPDNSLRAAGIAPWTVDVLTEADATPGTTVLAPHDLANYALFSAPNVSLPIHGYLDAFTSQELEALTAIWEVELGYEFALEDVGARHALMQEGNVLIAGLKKENWSVHHEQEGWVYLTSPGTAPLRVEAS